MRCLLHQKSHFNSSKNWRNKINQSFSVVHARISCEAHSSCLELWFGNFRWRCAQQTEDRQEQKKKKNSERFLKQFNYVVKIWKCYSTRSTSGNHWMWVYLHNTVDVSTGVNGYFGDFTHQMVCIRFHELQFVWQNEAKNFLIFIKTTLVSFNCFGFGSMWNFDQIQHFNFHAKLKSVFVHSKCE